MSNEFKGHYWDVRQFAVSSDDGLYIDIIQDYTDGDDCGGSVRVNKMQIELLIELLTIAANE
jgi:hypothetical protein